MTVAGISGQNTVRRVFVVLSARSLEYSRYALESLFHNALEPMRVCFVTDSLSDQSILEEEISNFPHAGQHPWIVYTSDELRDSEAAAFARYPNLRQFRHGHPCWRKITDPALLSTDGEEMVILDPDVYFPNRFRFEQTLQTGLLLMWQNPNCLLPPEVVSRAMEAGIALARHVDIGVAQWRMPVDFEWLEWLLGRLGRGRPLPHVMHVEAIVWSALAMHIGGGSLDPNAWRCWRRSQLKRLLHRAGVPGPWLLRFEPFAAMKCFHSGGEAKYWLEAAKLSGWMDYENLLTAPRHILPFVELTRGRYNREQRMKRLLRKCGYYRVFPSA